jgi:hypothetical protein
MLWTWAATTWAASPRRARSGWKKFMEVERFSHVMHIVSYVTAKLRDGWTP